jgi:hypothetical protein
MMRIYIFECKSDNNLYGFTFNSTGEILPKQVPCSEGWKLFKQIQIEEDKPVPLLGIDQTHILSGIKEKGYYLYGDEG